MLRRIAVIALGYALPAAIFGALLTGSRFLRAYWGIALDPTPAIILLLIGAAWYAGLGPGLLVAGLFEGTIDYFAVTANPRLALPVIVIINRLLLFSSIVVFASARRSAEDRLRRQQRSLEETVARERSARDEAEAANRHKDEFLATVSHELRTPLNVIVGWANVLAKHNVDRDTSRRAIDAIERNAAAQARIVEDLLDASAMIKGRVRLSHQRVLLAEVVQQAIEAMRLAASAKHQQFEVTLDRTVYVSGDDSRLLQVAMNLISNAVKFTPDAGWIEVAVAARAGRAYLTVRDNGIGIGPEFLPDVFAPFRQADASMTRAERGLGLGLSIVRRLVDMHGGTVQVESEGPGRGALFTVELPQAAPPARQHEASSVRAARVP